MLSTVHKCSSRRERITTFCDCGRPNSWRAVTSSYTRAQQPIKPMRSFSPERESITAASSTHEESLADALASAVPSSGPDHRFLRDDCGGVPAWEVQMLVDPAPSPKPLTPTEEDSLLQMAARARADGQHWRAHTLAEQAYAGRRSLSTLLYLIGIRVDELGEATFGAAAYHTMLRVLPLRDDERAKVITLFKKAHKTMFTQRRHEDAAVLIQYRATQLRRGKKHGLPTGTSALAPSGAPSMAPAATQGRLPFEEKLERYALLDADQPMGGARS